MRCTLQQSGPNHLCGSIMSTAQATLGLRSFRGVVTTSDCGYIRAKVAAARETGGKDSMAHVHMMARRGVMSVRR